MKKFTMLVTESILRPAGWVRSLFIGSTQNTKENETRPNFSIPTVSNRGTFRNIKDVFDDVAKQTLQEVHPFSDTEKDDILCLIHDYLENARQDTFDTLWNRYFSTRQWVWDEFEFWRSLALQGRLVPFFSAGRDAFALKAPEEVFELMSVQKVKVVLLEAGLEAPKCDVKKWAVASLTNLPDLFEKIKSQCVEKEKQKELRILIQTIRDRSKSLQTLRVADKVELQAVGKQDQSCIEIALRRKPNAIPPFWPGSIIGYRAIFKELDS